MLISLARSRVDWEDEGMQILRSSDYIEQRWKNGKGLTREILREPAHGEFDWRLSMADIVESGEFSIFPGVDRVLVLLEGAPVTLKHQDGSLKVLSLLEPYRFAGETLTHAEVKSHGLDFNVMTRRGRVQSDVRVTRLASGASRTSSGVLFCVSGKLTVGASEIGPFDALDCREKSVEVLAKNESLIIEVILV